MMNRLLQNTAIATILGFIAASAGACPESAEGGTFEIYESMSVPTMAMFSGSASGKSISVHIDDDTIHVTLNGEPVPADRIQIDSGRLIILDEDGNPIEDFNISVAQPSAIAGGVGIQGRALGWVGRGGGEGGAGVPFTAALPLIGSTYTPAKVMIGVTMSTPGAALEAHLKLDPGSATLITGVYEGLPAASAGLGENDVIVKVNGAAPANPDTIRKALAELKPGDELELSVIHPGKQKAEDIAVKTEARDPARMGSAKYRGTGAAGESFNEMTDLPLRIAVQRMQDAEAHEAERVLRDVMRTYRVSPDRELFVTPSVPPTDVLRRQAELEADKARIEAERTEDIEKRLQQLDERIEKLDRLLEELLKRQQAEN